MCKTRFLRPRRGPPAGARPPSSGRRARGPAPPRAPAPPQASEVWRSVPVRQGCPCTPAGSAVGSQRVLCTHIRSVRARSSRTAQYFHRIVYKMIQEQRNDRPTACVVCVFEGGTPPPLAAAYESSCESSATPRLIQKSCGLSLGSRTYMTKLVEWPVVDSTPRRSLVL